MAALKQCRPQAQQQQTVPAQQLLSQQRSQTQMPRTHRLMLSNLSPAPSGMPTAWIAVRLSVPVLHCSCIACLLILHCTAVDVL